MKDIIKEVRRVNIRTKRLVDTLMAGNYHSIFKGKGIEFSEIRDYTPGDDIRAIDWNVTARFDKPFIKEFIEERDLRVYVVCDVSGSSDFGRIQSKKRKSMEFLATIMFSAMQNNDAVGLALCTDSLEAFIPAKKGKRHVFQLLGKLVRHEPQSKQTNLNQALKSLAHLLKRRSIIFIVSDFMDEHFEKPLQLLRQRHDVIAVQMCDTREFELPDVGCIELEDEETGEQVLVDTSDPEFQKKYDAVIRKEFEKTKKLFRKLKIDSMEVRTEEDFVVPLKRFFSMRRHRVVN